MIQSFDAIVYKDSRILILGSIPSMISLEKYEYYGNRRNRFWKIMEQLKNTTLPTYNDKLEALKTSHIALWDVIKACDRKGSLDSNIRCVEVNAIDKLIEEYDSIEWVICNGKKSYDLYNKYFSHLSIEVLYLPSTSNANQTVKEVDLLKQWLQVLHKMGE